MIILYILDWHMDLLSYTIAATATSSYPYIATSAYTNINHVATSM